MRFWNYCIRFYYKGVIQWGVGLKCKVVEPSQSLQSSESIHFFTFVNLKWRTSWHKKQHVSVNGPIASWWNSLTAAFSPRFYLAVPYFTASHSLCFRLEIMGIHNIKRGSKNPPSNKINLLMKKLNCITVFEIIL